MMYFWRMNRPFKARLTVLPAALLMVSFLILPAQAAIPALKIKPGAAVEGSPIKFVIALSAKATRRVKVHWQTKDGSAVQPGDYTASSGDAVIKLGKTKAVISVPTTADPDAEADETFSVELSKPSGARIKTGTAVGTITNDDAGTSLAIENATLTEGNAGTSAASFVVNLSAPSPNQVTVDYATQDGTASSGGTAAAGGDDYEAASGTLTFLPGDTSEVANVTVNGDTTFEGVPTTTSETLSVILSNPAGASVSTGTGTGTITNDDAQPSLAIGNATLTEGNAGTSAASFTVNLSAPSQSQVSVDYSTQNGIAQAGGVAAAGGDDYEAASGTLTFLPGDTSEVANVTVNGDNTFEASETFSVTLSNPAGASVSTGTGTGTITNDDAQPTISIADVSNPEGSSAGSTTQFSFNVMLERPSAQTVSVSFATGTAGATNPASLVTDFSSAFGTLTFVPGDTSETVTVNVNQDTTVEANETFFVNLSGPSNATISDSQGLGTILNDD
jgi:urease beta subunit